jgi:TolB-like protein
MGYWLPLPKKLGISIALVLSVAGLLGACSDVYTNDAAYMSGKNTSMVDLVTTSHQIVDRLVDTSQQLLDRSEPIIVASLVNVSDLQQSSVLGRIVAEQIRSRLTQLGYVTQELRYRGSILVRAGNGELVLSRDVKNISAVQQAQAVVAGVYAVAETNVYLTLRILRAEDGIVISSADYALPKGEDVTSLLDSDPVLVY